MAKAAAISFKEFRTRYHTAETCRKALFRQRFPDGFVCPKCRSKEFYSIRSRNICQCRFCLHQTSVTAGTMMHRTHLPLTIWFWAIYLCLTDKRGISAVQISGRWESAMTLPGIYQSESAKLWGKETNITNFPAL